MEPLALSMFSTLHSMWQNLQIKSYWNTIACFGLQIEFSHN